MAKGKIEIRMSDEELMRCRESGESIQSIAAKNNVSFGTMQRIIKALEIKKEELQLMDTVGDGAGTFYTVIDISGDEITLKSRENLKNEKISKKEFMEGKTKFHKLAVAPVTVYNLKDQEPEESRTPEGPGISEEPEDTLCERTREYERFKIRGYLLRIDRILSAAKGIGKEAEPALYDLVQEILRNGFDAEFRGKE